MAFGLHSPEGYINVTVVNGLSRVNRYAPDGSWNVVQATGTAWKGANHPCGALWVTVAPSTGAPARAPDGSLYVTESGAFGRGTRIKVVSGAFGGGTLTWDPARKAANITLSNGNLTGSLGINTFYATMLATGSGRSSGKFYFEETLTTMNPDGQGVGFGNASADLNGLGGVSANSLGWRVGGGIFVNNVSLATIQTFAQGDILAVAVDLTAKLVWFRTNNSLNWNNSGAANPATGVGGVDYTASGLAAGPYFPMTTLEINGDNFTGNFGATAYTLTAPAGFGNW